MRNRSPRSLLPAMRRTVLGKGTGSCGGVGVSQRELSWGSGPKGTSGHQSMSTSLTRGHVSRGMRLCASQLSRLFLPMYTTTVTVSLSFPGSATIHMSAGRSMSSLSVSARDTKAVLGHLHGSHWSSFTSGGGPDAGMGGLSGLWRKPWKPRQVCTMDGVQSDHLRKAQKLTKKIAKKASSGPPTLITGCLASLPRHPHRHLTHRHRPHAKDGGHAQRHRQRRDSLHRGREFGDGE
mmetsp:Transcript_22523/g.55529  ORF Transcript_22523/g.55529 Transcript_22523/m.55529 type:complete len:236 (-) Transcript_22523:386-1093(-)